MNKTILSIFGFALLCIACTNSTKHTPNKIVGYLAGWKNTDFETIDASKFTHINYAFANIVDGQVACEKAYDTVAIAQLHKMRAQNPKLKLLISVGGWVWSNHFSDVALTKASRAKFVKSAIAFTKFFEFDGVDLDWEYPGQLGEDNVFRAEDKENFTLLLKDLRQALDFESAQQGREQPYLLTIASGADDKYIENTNLGEAQKYLDFINIMTYDFYSGFHSTTGHHANFKVAAEKPEDNSVIQSVERHIAAGVPSHKLVMGLPFYSRTWWGVSSAENNGRFQKARTVGTIEPYSKVVEYLQDSNFQKLWDENAQAPYLFNAQDSIFVSYDNVESISLKFEYLKKMGLAGFMYWEYNNDNGNELLDHLNTLIKIN